MFAAELLSCTDTPPCSTATPCPESPERLTDVATVETTVVVAGFTSALMRSKVEVAGLVEVAAVVVGVLVKRSEMSDVPAATAQKFPLHPFVHTWYCCVAHALVW